MPVGLSDALEFVESDETKLTITGFQIEGNSTDNLILKAYRQLKKDFKLPELHFHLHKAIPHGAGLGGGSSDAAFTLKMLNTFFKLGISESKLMEHASKLGADCAFFILNRPCFAEGIGNQFTPVDFNISEFKTIILKPPFGVNTADAYKSIKPKPPGFNLKTIGLLPVENWKDLIFNDFEDTVFGIYPEIAAIKQRLYNLGASYVSMSGSGSAVFALFRHLPADIEKQFPERYFIYR
jgi:4-diphosphocytidyl-2-C-methyl-D-erythritol kinase